MPTTFTPTNTATVKTRADPSNQGAGTFEGWTNAPMIEASEFTDGTDTFVFDTRGLPQRADDSQADLVLDIDLQLNAVILALTPDAASAGPGTGELAGSESDPGLAIETGFDLLV